MIRKLLKFAYHLLYQPFAWTYDWVAALVSCGSWTDSILALLPHLPGPRVLELGHGPGHLQLALSQLGQNTIGIDISPQMGSIARHRLEKGGYEVRLAKSYAQYICFPSNGFNQVVATYPAEYIFDPRTLQEVIRILAPGGQLIILLSAWLTGNSLCHRLTRILIPFANPKYARNLERVLRPFTQAGFQAKIELLDNPTSQLLIIVACPTVERKTE